MKQFLILALAAIGALPVFSQKSTFRNPVLNVSTPDPTVIQVEDGSFYLYSTESIRNMPIYHSRDLVHWQQVGTVFTDESRPRWNPKGRLWAPDINKIGDKYVIYYAKSEWGGEWTCGIGVATADKPEGPFTDHGPLFSSKDVNIMNCIDPFYIEDNGHPYLFWGSFHGIYGCELTADGLRLKPSDTPKRIAGTFMEGTYIKKHGKYYYLFGSTGSCCNGLKSTYRVTVGRSTSLFGPYVDSKGNLLLTNHFDVILRGNEHVAGPGHNAEIVTDKKGHDWMLYHGYDKADADGGRVLYLDRVKWVKDWPEINGGAPSVVESEAPQF